MIIVFFLCRK